MKQLVSNDFSIHLSLQCKTCWDFFLLEHTFSCYKSKITGSQPWKCVSDQFALNASSQRIANVYLVLVGSVACASSCRVDGRSQLTFIAAVKLASSPLNLIESEILSQHLEKSEEILLLHSSDSAKFLREQSDRVNVTKVTNENSMLEMSLDV